MFLTKLNEVLASKKSFFSDPLNAGSLLASGFLNIIHWAIIYSKIKPSSGNVLLHYSVVSGPDLVQKGWYAYWIPLLALVLLLINMMIASVFYKKEKLAAYCLNFSSIAVQLIFLAAGIVLVVANG
jgi:hypothetical protein